MKPPAGERPTDHTKILVSESDNDSRASSKQNERRPLNEYEGTVSSFFKDRKGQSQLGTFGDSKLCLKLQLKSVRSEAASRWKKHLLARVDEDSDDSPFACAAAAESGEHRGNILGEGRGVAQFEDTGLVKGAIKDGQDIRVDEYKLQAKHFLIFDLLNVPLRDLKKSRRNRNAKQSQVGKLRHDRMGHGQDIKHWLDRCQRQSDHREQGLEELDLHRGHSKCVTVRMFKEKQDRHVKKPTPNHRRHSSRNTTKQVCLANHEEHDTVCEKRQHQNQGHSQTRDNGGPEMKTRTKQTQDHHQDKCIENQDLKRGQGQRQGRGQEHDTVCEKRQHQNQGHSQTRDNGGPEMKTRTKQTQDHHQDKCIENQDSERGQGQGQDRGQGQGQERNPLLVSQNLALHPLRRAKAYLTLLSLSNISLHESELTDILSSESDEDLVRYKEPTATKLSSQDTQHAAARNSCDVSREESICADTDQGRSQVCSRTSGLIRHGATDDRQEVEPQLQDSTDISGESSLFQRPSPENSFTGKSINGYDFVKIFSGGASSVIFKVTKGGITYAAKVFKRIHPYEERLLKISKREYKIMKKLNHPHIVKVYDYFVFRLHGVIIMEYVETSELWKFFDKSNWAMSLPILKKILWGILSALRHLHKHRISHMDIKTNNMLVDSKGFAKITDFGGAVKFNRFFSKRNVVNFFTPDFAPPEKQWQRESGELCVVHYKRYDMWSVGVMLYHMYTGRLPYTLPEGRQYLPAKLFTGVVDLPSGVKEDAQVLSLVRQCMQVNPLDRVTAKEALAHPFFDSVRHKGVKK